MKNRSPAEHVRSLEKGFQVLRAFSRTHPRMTLSQVAARTHLTRAAARRALHTLERLGYLRRVGRTYLLAPRLLVLTARYLDAARIDQVLLPFLEEIVEAHGGHAAAAVLDGDRTIHVAHVSAYRSPRVQPGVEMPASATASGLVLLAHVSTSVGDDASARGPSDTGAAADALGPLLASIRRKGFAIVENELDRGVLSVAVPVRGPHGGVVAAASCGDRTGGVTRLNLVEERLPALRAAAVGIERALREFPALAQSGDAADGAA